MLTQIAANEGSESKDGISPIGGRGVQSDQVAVQGFRFHEYDSTELSRIKESLIGYTKIYEILITFLF